MYILVRIKQNINKKQSKGRIRTTPLLSLCTYNLFFSLCTCAVTNSVHVSGLQAEKITHRYQLVRLVLPGSLVVSGQYVQRDVAACASR